MTVGTAPTIAEQRRSRRYRRAVAVDLVDKRGAKRALTVDVARHGLFVAVTDPPHNRHLVQLAIHLPDGPLTAAATVARVIPGKGVGLALFALSADAKRRWDAFILDAAQREPVGSGPIPSFPPTPSSSSSSSVSSSPAPSSSMAPVASAQLPSFIVRLKSLDRLREYQQNHVAVGGTVLFTPVLPPAGSGVQLIVVHPLTYAEFPLYGQIHRSIIEPPKRLEILFVGVEAEAFHTFVETGRPPSKPPTPVSTTPRAAAEPEPELEIDIDEDDGAMQEEPVEWDLRCEIGAVLDEIKDEDDNEDTARAPRPATSTALGFSIDTADSAIFEHGPDDDGEELVIDDTMAAVDPGLRPTVYRLRCETASCPSEPYQLELGPCAGVLGLVADQTPWWSTDSGRVVSVPRLLPADARRARFVAYLDRGGTLSDVVNLAVVLAAADLAESPRHPVTAEPLKNTRAIERLAATARRVGEAPAPTKVRCPHCDSGHLLIERA